MSTEQDIEICLTCKNGDVMVQLSVLKKCPALFSMFKHNLLPQYFKTKSVSPIKIVLNYLKTNILNAEAITSVQEAYEVRHTLMEFDLLDSKLIDNIYTTDGDDVSKPLDLRMCQGNDNSDGDASDEIKPDACVPKNFHLKKKSKLRPIRTPVCKQLYLFYVRAHNCDVQVRCLDGKNIPAHGLILEAASYTSPEWHLNLLLRVAPKYSYAVVKPFIDYCYKGYCEIHGHEIQDSFVSMLSDLGLKELALRLVGRNKPDIIRKKAVKSYVDIIMSKPMKLARVDHQPTTLPPASPQLQPKAESPPIPNPGNLRDLIADVIADTDAVKYDKQPKMKRKYTKRAKLEEIIQEKTLPVDDISKVIQTVSSEVGDANDGRPESPFMSSIASDDDDDEGNGVQSFQNDTNASPVPLNLAVPNNMAADQSNFKPQVLYRVVPRKRDRKDTVKHVCEFCNKSFSYSSCLSTHRRIHLENDQRRFPCMHCDFSAHQKINLRRHLTSRHKMSDEKARIVIEEQLSSTSTEVAYQKVRAARLSSAVPLTPGSLVKSSTGLEGDEDDDDDDDIEHSFNIDNDEKDGPISQVPVMH